MLVGLGITIYYMLASAPWLRAALYLPPAQLWWGILPVAGGVFGVLTGVVVTVAFSLLLPRPVQPTPTGKS